MARAHMPMFTASCGRTRMIAGPPPSGGLVLSVPAPTMAAGYSTAERDAMKAKVRRERARQVSIRRGQSATIKPCSFGRVVKRTYNSYSDPAAGSGTMSDERDIVEKYNEYTKRNREKFIHTPLRNVAKGFQIIVSWLNLHNGLLTAIATAAIAYLTVSISADSKRQAETAVELLSANQSQQKIMQGQLDEMQKQREFTIDQLRASFKRQDIRYQPIDKIGNPVSNTDEFVREHHV